MDAFETAIRSAINSSLRTTIKGYVFEFANTLTQKINERTKGEELDEKQIVELWDTMTQDLIINPRAKKLKEVKDPSSPCCCHIFGKGDKKDQKCGDKISVKSGTGNFCGKHYKQHETPKSGKKSKNDEKQESENKCCPYILKKGEHEGDECGKKITGDNDFCSKHKKSGDKKSGDKKSGDKKSGDKKSGDKKKEKSGDKKNKKVNKSKSKEKDESSLVQIKAKQIKEGELKGMCYFQHENKKYVFDAKSKIVSGTMNDEGSLVELTDGDIEFISEMPPFQVEKKNKEEKNKDDEEDIPVLEKEQEIEEKVDKEKVDEEHETEDEEEYQVSEDDNDV